MHKGKGMLLRLREIKVLPRCMCNERADRMGMWRNCHKNTAFGAHGDCENRHVMQFYVWVLITSVKRHNTKANKGLFFFFSDNTLERVRTDTKTLRSATTHGHSFIPCVQWAQWQNLPNHRESCPTVYIILMYPVKKNQGHSENKGS